MARIGEQHGRRMRTMVTSVGTFGDTHIQNKFNEHFWGHGNYMNMCQSKWERMEDKLGAFQEH